MFSLRITSQSLSLHLGNSPPCLEMGGGREGRKRGEKERGKRGRGSCFLKQCYKKVVKKPQLFTSG